MERAVAAVQESLGVPFCVQDVNSKGTIVALTTTAALLSSNHAGRLAHAFYAMMVWSAASLATGTTWMMRLNCHLWNKCGWRSCAVATDHLCSISRQWWASSCKNIANAGDGHTEAPETHRLVDVYIENNAAKEPTKRRSLQAYANGLFIRWTNIDQALRQS